MTKTRVENLFARVYKGQRAKATDFYHGWLEYQPYITKVNYRNSEATVSKVIKKV